MSKAESSRTAPNRTRGVFGAFSAKSTVVIALLVVALILGFTLPSPYVIQRPGPVVDTLGTIVLDGETTQVIDIQGERTFESSGSLNLLTVSTVGSPARPLGWLTLAPALLDRTQEIVHVDEIYPAGQDPEEREEANRLLMEQSQAAATAAALGLLGVDYQVTIVVEAIVAGLPAEGLLQEGDEILAVDGAEVSGGAAIRTQVMQKTPGETVVFDVRRDAEVLQIEVSPRHDPGGTAVVGILMDAEHDFPIEVAVALDRIGGPSAGLMFALGIYDELTEGFLTDGRIVSGTGTVDEDGNVGPIGGLTQKIWGASRADTELFLMPVDNCHDLPAELPADMHIVPVATAREAVDVIEAVVDGDAAGGLERCDSVIAQGISIG